MGIFYDYFCCKIAYTSCKNILFKNLILWAILMLKLPLYRVPYHRDPAALIGYVNESQMWFLMHQFCLELLTTSKVDEVDINALNANFGNLKNIYYFVTDRKFWQSKIKNLEVFLAHYFIKQNLGKNWQLFSCPRTKIFIWQTTENSS